MLYSIKIVLADDHEIFRSGFKSMLENIPDLIWSGDAEDGIELLKLCETVKPDIAFVDIKMPRMNGIEFCVELKKRSLKTKVITLSMFNEDYLIIEMLAAGATGYLLKNTNESEILKAAIAVYEGRNYYCNNTEQKLTQLIANNQYHPHKKKKKIHLSEREVEVLKLICDQFSNKEIAIKLHISIRTVETYREILGNKTSSKNLAGLVIYAVKNGLYNPHQFE